MEPLPGIVALAAVFDRARGARLDAAERFVSSLPRLFPNALVGCDLAWQPRAGVFAVVMRFAERRFGVEGRRRLDFWLARAGVRSTALAEVSAAQRASFFANLEACQARVMGVAPDRLPFDAADLFTAAGAPVGRRQPGATDPLLAMDVGGPGWEGVRYVAEEPSLFIPGLLAPALGDELMLCLRVPGLERPFETRAKVAWVRTADEGEGAQAGFSLTLLDAAPELLGALAARQPPAVSLSEAALRAHPRYAVKAPVVVTPWAQGGEGAPRAESPAAALETAEEPVPTSELPLAEYGGDAELTGDYLENLSQGGAFVRTAQPAAVGDRVRLSLRLPGGEAFSAPAVVAMVNDRGMGVRFELDEAGQQRLAAAIAHLSARARRALVVDDDAVVRRMLQEALQQRGFEVLTADDGSSGLSLLADELLALDLLVTDIRMRRMDGETFIRTIRRAGGEADLAIVAMTGGLEGDLEKRLERDGADAVLDKALGPELIAQAADAVLERKRLVQA
jgi:CheY-like chemotaxis protein/Tfp pilus assembly protein PilZ